MDRTGYRILVGLAPDDRVPFISAVPAFDNVYLAAGHGLLGISMSPATGKLLAELMTSQTPHVDSQPYRIGR